jgi:16S rRNA (adenine1518-N6/adenine1519-N6)-dimethyltransferase
MSFESLPPLREVIRSLGLSARKSLSQNFILDLNVTRRIARAAGSLAGRTVIEVGPGPGGLTRALIAEGAEHIVAIERDPRCEPALAEIAGRVQGRLKVIIGDATKIELGALAKGRRAIIVANLPYASATSLLVSWLTLETWPPWYESLTLMFQREVAERVVARPGERAYGRLSVLAGWRSRARILFDLPPTVFVPPPKVMSSLVRVEPIAEPLPSCRLADLEKIAAAAFGQRRKMLRSSLRQLATDPEALLRQAKISPEVRPEQLSVAEFCQLAQLIAKARN